MEGGGGGGQCICLAEWLYVLLVCGCCHFNHGCVADILRSPGRSASPITGSFCLAVRCGWCVFNGLYVGQAMSLHILAQKVSNYVTCFASVKFKVKAMPTTWRYGGGGGG